MINATNFTTPAIDVIKWWVGELSMLVPPAQRERFGGWRKRLLLIVDAPGDNFFEESGGRRRSLGRIDLRDTVASPRVIAAAVPRAGKHSSAEVVVCFGAQHALRTIASLPLAAEKNLKQVIGFEFEWLVPFKREEVYYTDRIVSRDKPAQTLRVELTVVPRSELTEISPALERLGLRVVGVEVASGRDGEAVATIPLSSGGVQRSPGMRRTNIAFAVLAILLVMTCIVIPLFRARVTIDHLDEEIAVARRSAEAAAALDKQISTEDASRHFVVDRKRAMPTVTEILDALTRLVPDDTYLAELSIAGAQIHLTGASASATALLALIDQSTSFRNASFQSSITQDPKLNRERFDITARIAPRTLP